MNLDISLLLLKIEIERIFGTHYEEQLRRYNRNIDLMVFKNYLSLDKDFCSNSIQFKSEEDMIKQEIV